ncbi:MAG: hypothetical protein MO852_10960 [Candidatus Devosia euplotis]|nr:hypothetical protein [Candidatus Devosia euplotis]
MIDSSFSPLKPHHEMVSVLPCAMAGDADSRTAADIARAVAIRLFNLDFLGASPACGRQWFFVVVVPIEAYFFGEACASLLFELDLR